MTARTWGTTCPTAPATAPPHGGTRRPGSGRATIEPATHGSRRPRARARPALWAAEQSRGRVGSAVQPWSLPLSALPDTLVPLRVTTQATHSLTHLPTYSRTHYTPPLRLLHQSGLGAAACSKWPPWQCPSSAPALHPLRERPRRRLAYLSGSIPSRGEADPLGDEPQPQVLEPAASRVDSSTGL